MDARMTKVEAALLLPLPRNLVIEQIEAVRQAASRANQAVLMQGFARLADLVLGWPARRRLRAELTALTERELADIGLTRGDIGRVIDGSLAGIRR
jgi:uncharacterized protein YjiS (DUF1127 family)